MKIVMLTRRTVPEVGGVERHVSEVIRVLKKKGYQVKVLSERDIWYPRLPVLGLLWIWAWMLRNRKIFGRAELVHIHDVFIWYLPLRLLFWQKPVYVTFHGWEGKYPIPLRYKLIRGLSAQLSRGNICVGRYIEKWYGIKADYLTYGAVEDKNKKTKARKEPPKILFVGRLAKDTGLPVYLEALAKLGRERKFEAEFLGDGPLRQDAEKLGKVLGFRQNTEKHMENSDLVFTSGYLSMLEAAALKKPILATYDNELKRDYLRLSPFAKFIFIEKSPHKLAEKAAYLLRYPEREEKRLEEGYNWARQQTWEKLSRLYLRLWQKS